MTNNQMAKHREFMSLLVLSAWSGLVAGLLEVSTIVIRKEMFDANQLYGMSRHFIWLIAVTNRGAFLIMGFFGRSAGLALPHSARWLLMRILCALVLLPMALIAFPRIYTLAWLALTLGLACHLVPWIESYAWRFQWFVQVSLPLALV